MIEATTPHRRFDLPRRSDLPLFGALLAVLLLGYVIPWIVFNQLHHAKHQMTYQVAGVIGSPFSVSTTFRKGNWGCNSNRTIWLYPGDQPVEVMHQQIAPELAGMGWVRSSTDGDKWIKYGVAGGLIRYEDSLRVFEISSYKDLNLNARVLGLAHGKWRELEASPHIYAVEMITQQGIACPR